jgi:hypothetical protein
MKISKSSLAAFAALSLVFNASADVTGEFTGVSFWASNGGKSFDVSGGSGTLKNEKSELVAQGDLQTVDKVMAIKATTGATFVCKPSTDAFAADAFSTDPVNEFASVELGDGNQWTLKDAKFQFVLEVRVLNQPQIFVALEKSLARASSITLKKGTYSLWGYTVTVEKATGTIKVAHGKIVDATDATYK